jgi:hypothetical protein
MREKREKGEKREKKASFLNSSVIRRLPVTLTRGSMKHRCLSHRSLKKEEVYTLLSGTPRAVESGSSLNNHLSEVD